MELEQLLKQYPVNVKFIFGGRSLYWVQYVPNDTMGQWRVIDTGFRNIYSGDSLEEALKVLVEGEKK